MLDSFWERVVRFFTEHPMVRTWAIYDNYAAIQECNSRCNYQANGNRIHLLMLAKAWRLKSRGEMRHLLAIIENSSGLHPNWLPEKLRDYDLLAFLKFCHKHNHSTETGADLAFSIALFSDKIKTPFVTTEYDQQRTMRG